MLIVGYHVSQCSNDMKEIGIALSILKDFPGEHGGVTSLLADAGYFSADNLLACGK
jgi:hypothetical protein